MTLATLRLRCRLALATPAAPAATPASPATPAAERRLVRLVRVLLAFESAMYSAVTPVLPHYAHVLHASTPSIGALAAGYPAGLIPGALLGGWLAGRAGVRRTTLAGLIGFGLAIAGFGIADRLGTLDALRVVQGLFCGLIWGGGLTWVIAAAPRERRGSVIGRVIGAATFGTLIGPLLGTAAVAIGTGPVFAATGLAALGLAAWTGRQPDPAPAPARDAPARDAPDPAPTAPVPARTAPVPARIAPVLAQTTPAPAVAPARLRAALSSSGLRLGTWLITLEAITFGATSALLPLRLSRLGAAGWEIGATFVLVAALSTALSPLVGRSADRRGPHATIAVGLAAAAPLLALLSVPRSPLLLAALTVVAIGAPLTACMIPAVSLMTASAERAGVTLIVVTTLVNLAYAVGETIGAPAAASLAQVTGDRGPLLLVAALMLATLVATLRAARRRDRTPSGRPRADAPSRSRRRVPLHTTGAARPGDRQRRARGGPRRRADLPDRPPAVRLGPGAPAVRGDAPRPDHGPGPGRP